MTSFSTLPPTGIRPIPRPGETSFRILGAIAQHWKENNFGPTIEELRQEVGLSSRSGVQFHVTNLLQSGWLDNVPNRRRTLTLTSKGRSLIRVFEEIS